METALANLDGLFKTNTDIVKKAIEGISVEHWFLTPGDDSNHLIHVGQVAYLRKWLGYGQKRRIDRENRTANVDPARLKRRRIEVRFQ